MTEQREILDRLQEKLDEIEGKMKVLQEEKEEIMKKYCAIYYGVKS